MTPRMPRDTIATHNCGWTGRPTTPGIAAYALRKHSCDKQRRRNESAARGVARKAAVDRRPKPCLHKIAEHCHGTYPCYVLDECRCAPCAKANSDYEKRRVRTIAYGRYDRLVDAAPARAHVASLMTAGLGLKQIAKVSGVSHGSLWKLMYGKRGRNGRKSPAVRVTTANAEKLLAVHVTLDTLAAGALIDAAGTHRRLQALVALGWSQAKLADRLGMLGSNLGALLNRSRVSVRTARSVIALYDQLWDTPPPQARHRDRIAASRSRRYAVSHGWHAPLAWDDDTIDDPAMFPGAAGDESGGFDEVAVLRIMAGTLPLPRGPRGVLTTPEFLEALRRMAARLNDTQIGRQLGMTTDAVLKQRHRNDIPSSYGRGVA